LPELVSPQTTQVRPVGGFLPPTLCGLEDGGPACVVCMRVCGACGGHGPMPRPAASDMGGCGNSPGERHSIRGDGDRDAVGLNVESAPGEPRRLLTLSETTTNTVSSEHDA
jgi:hypothetical protein